MRNELDLIQALDLPQFVVRDLISNVCRAVSPSCASALDLVDRKSGALHTTLPALDSALHGGLPPSSITEVVGPAGVGKTQFCHQMAVQACLPVEEGGLGGCVVYIDTEAAFSPKRLVEILTTRYPRYAEAGNVHSLLQPFTQRVTVYRVDSTTDLMTRLDSLEETIIENNVKLIVVDSIASVARKDFDDGGVMRRQALLAAQAATLKRLAENFNIPVLVSNQVTTTSQRPYYEFDRPHFGGADKSLYVTAALGYVWAHAVNTRIVLEFKDMGLLLDEGGMVQAEGLEKRCLTVAKSPLAPVRSYPYAIDASGINLQGDAEEADLTASQENATALIGNFWERKIAGRQHTAPGFRMDAQHHNLFG